MNRILSTVALALLCGTLTFASTDRGRNTHLGNSNKKTEQKLPVTRPGSAARPGGTSSQGRPNNNSKPSQGNHNNHRPGNNHNNNQQRPGHNDYRPGNNWNHNQGNHRPQGPQGPHGSHGPMKPGYNPGHGHAPSHPHMPHHYGWYRPAPPPQWRPVPGWRPFQSILGVALGSTLNITLNALINSGYNVVSYGTNDVFVSNVPMLNMIWPDAVLFYNNSGGLCGSRFIYSTPYYDQGRYNAAYASLLGGYGSPVSIQNTNSGGVEAIWWGTNNQFIRLSYDAAYAQDGSLRYFTTLSFGN